MKQFYFGFLFTAIIFFGSCSRQAEVIHHEDNHHESSSFQLIAYSNRTELFAEAEPFVTGKPSEMLVHLSSIRDFRPIAGARVSSRIISERDTIYHSSSELVKPGIYLLSITPKHAGTHQMHFIYENEITSDTLLLADIVVSSDAHDAEHLAEELERSDPNGVFFTKEQSWKIEFETGFAKPTKQGIRIQTTALVELLPSELYFVSAGINGIIIDTNDHLFQGKKFRKGEIIAQISGNNLADNSIQVKISAAKSFLDKAEKNYTRKKALAEENIVSQEELEEARLEYELAHSEYENLSSAYQSSGQIIRAPEDGFIHRNYASNGSFVHPGDSVLSFSFGKKLLVSAELSPSYRTLLQGKLDGTIQTPEGEYLSLSTLNSKTLSIGQSTQSKNYLIPLHLAIDWHPNLTPGTFTELNLISAGENERLLVPASAIIEEQENYFVFIQIHPELFEKRKVDISYFDGLQTIIRSGMNDRERLVTKGARMIKLAQASGGLDAHAGHNH